MYRPEPAPQDVRDLPGYVGRELERVGEALSAPSVPFVQFQVHHRAPEKPRIGRVYYADGSDWDPGAGEGLYLFTSAGWVKL